MIDKKTADQVTPIAFILLLIGGINWGLVAFDFNLVEMLGLGTMVNNIIYGVVGLSAIALAYFKYGMKNKLGL